MKRLCAIGLLVVAGCAQEPPPKEPAGEPPASGEWKSPMFHISGRLPDGWSAAPAKDPAIVAATGAAGVIELRAIEVDSPIARPDEKMLEALAGRWKMTSSCRFDLFGVNAVRGDFDASDGGDSISTQIAWEWHEGAPPGRKFLFFAVLVAAQKDALQGRRALEDFLNRTTLDRDGPDAVTPDLFLAEGWVAHSLGRDRAVVISGCRIPDPHDPFSRRDVPVAGWLDVRDRLREKRDRGALTDEETLLEAQACYNLSLQMLWAQIGAPETPAPGMRMSSRAFLQVFSRHNASVAENAANVLKLKAIRDGKSWEYFERMRLNALALESVAAMLRGKPVDADVRDGLETAARGAIGDYRMLAYSLTRDVAPDIAEQEVARTRKAFEVLEAGRPEEAIEIAEDAISTSGGRWGEAWRIIAEAHFELKRLDNAVGACRNAVVKDPENPSLLLDYAEILVAAGRADDALAILDAHDVAIRDSLRDNDLLDDELRAEAFLRKGDAAGAQAAASALLDEWEREPPRVVVWSFAASEKNLAADAPGRDRILAMHALLTGKLEAAEFRKSWDLAAKR